MHTDSSASRTAREAASAVEWATTVRMPRSRQVRRMRRAISPRLAIRILWNMDRPAGAARARPAGSARLQQEQRLPVLDGLGVLHEDLRHPPGRLGLDLVHQLHRLDDAEDLPLLDDIAFEDERRGVGAGGA